MKKLMIMIACISIIPTIGMAENPKITQLIKQKQEKMAQLEKCTGTTKGLKIAGISTLGLTAVGVAGNIWEATEINKNKNTISNLDTNIEKTQKEINEKNEAKIAANAAAAEAERNAHILSNVVQKDIDDINARGGHIGDTIVTHGYTPEQLPVALRNNFADAMVGFIKRCRALIGNNGIGDVSLKKGEDNNWRTGSGVSLAADDVLESLGDKTEIAKCKITKCKTGFEEVKNSEEIVACKEKAAATTAATDAASANESAETATNAATTKSGTEVATSTTTTKKSTSSSTVAQSVAKEEVAAQQAEAPAAGDSTTVKSTEQTQSPAASDSTITQSTAAQQAAASRGRDLGGATIECFFGDGELYTTIDGVRFNKTLDYGWPSNREKREFEQQIKDAGYSNFILKYTNKGSSSSTSATKSATTTTTPPATSSSTTVQNTVEETPTPAVEPAHEPKDLNGAVVYYTMPFARTAKATIEGHEYMYRKSGVKFGPEENLIIQGLKAEIDKDYKNYQLVKKAM